MLVRYSTCQKSIIKARIQSSKNNNDACRYKFDTFIAYLSHPIFLHYANACLCVCSNAIRPYLLAKSEAGKKTRNPIISLPLPFEESPEYCDCGRYVAERQAVRMSNMIFTEVLLDFNRYLRAVAGPSSHQKHILDTTFAFVAKNSLEWGRGARGGGHLNDLVQFPSLQSTSL